MTLRILHAATHNHNIGDGALVSGMQACLREDWEENIDFVPLDVLESKLSGRRNMLTARNYRQMENEIDMVLVGGGGMIEGGKGNYLSGINFNFELAALEGAKIPWVFYALGFNQFRSTHFFHKRKLRRLVELASHPQHAFTLRNDGSSGRIQSVLPGADLTAIPDPGLFVPETQVPEFIIKPGRTNVILQLAADRISKRLGRSPRTFIDDIAVVVRHIVEEYGCHIVLAPHLITDLQLCARLTDALPPALVRKSVTATPVLSGAEAAPTFFSIYRAADLVLGMRGHSTICAIGTGTPVIGIATHDKIGGFLAEIGLPEWAVEVGPAFQTQLTQAVDTLFADLSGASQSADSARSDLRRQARAFHDSMRSLLHLRE